MPSLAIDALKTEQYTDQDGRLHYKGVHITKACVSPYYGREIVDYQALGLDPDKIYGVLRPADELAKAAASFNGLPLMDGHIHTNADDPQKDKVVGAIGTDVEWQAPYLDCDLTVWDADAITRIKSGKQPELSCSYYYDPVLETGNHEGQSYQVKMTNIRGNHVALVPEGRVGPEAALDGALPKGKAMKINAAQVLARVNRAMRTGKLANDASPDELADKIKKIVEEHIDADKNGYTQAEREDAEEIKRMKEEEERLKSDDEDEGEGEGDEGGKEDPDKSARDRKAARDKCAKDAEEICKDEEIGFKELVKKLVEKGHDEEDAKKIAAKIGEEKYGKEGMEARSEEGRNKAGDKAKDEERMEEKAKAAADAAIARYKSQIKAAADAASLVRPLVGNVAMDSAGDIYRFALKQRGIAYDGVNDAGLRALVMTQIAAVRPTPVRLASDSSPTIAGLKGIVAPRQL